MRYHHHVSEDAMLGAARALLKFSREHGHTPGALAPLEACISALERGDFRTAISEFERMSFGGMGRFDDWYPPVIYEHEDEAYVQTVFEALVERFHRLFRAAAGKA
jgi:hypothetical protein